MTFLNHFCKLTLKGRLLGPDYPRIFYEKIAELHESNATIIYRGIKKQKMMKLYHINENVFPQGMGKKLFMLGAKSNRYLSDSNDRSYAIDDCREELFEKIFIMINEVLRTCKPYGVVHRFINREKSLASYFENLSNLKGFRRLASSFTYRERINARDYYVSLLHHIQKEDFHPGSFLLSVSRRFYVASKFANPGNNNNKVILFGWVPEQNQNIIFEYLNEDIVSWLKSKSLPVYAKSFYPYEYEISLRGGLFPHFLVGFFYWENEQKYFEVNPNFLRDGDNNWINDGLSINQRNFKRILEETAYKRYFEAIFDGRYREGTNGR